MNSYDWMRRVGTLLSIPLTLGLSPVVGCAVGWALDRLFHTRPIFTLLGLAAGFAAGIRETWLLIRRTSEEPENKEDKG
ncbi:MAG: AtpZ/AtpI family protein [Candidatus Omnitrophica bacterium]|nr:AtpZ/AtpI family protein [Candidatus Omnitrophota bacterium]